MIELIGISWSLVLKHVCFQGHLIKLIMQSTTTSGLSIIWNREKLEGSPQLEVLDREIYYHFICLCFARRVLANKSMP